MPAVRAADPAARRAAVQVAPVRVAQVRAVPVVERAARVAEPAAVPVAERAAALAAKLRRDALRDNFAAQRISDLKMA
jgi:hypothetical protein